MFPIVEAAPDESWPAGDVPLHEIIDYGKKALHQKQSDEQAFDLLGLDGVRLPLRPSQLSVDGVTWRRMVSDWLGHIRDRAKYLPSLAETPKRPVGERPNLYSVNN